MSLNDLRQDDKDRSSKEVAPFRIDLAHMLKPRPRGLSSGATAAQKVSAEQQSRRQRDRQR